MHWNMGALVSESVAPELWCKGTHKDHASPKAAQMWAQEAVAGYFWEALQIAEQLLTAKAYSSPLNWPLGIPKNTWEISLMDPSILNLFKSSVGRRGKNQKNKI